MGVSRVVSHHGSPGPCAERFAINPKVNIINFAERYVHRISIWPDHFFLSKDSSLFISHLPAEVQEVNDFEKVYHKNIFHSERSFFYHCLTPLGT